MSKLTLEDIEEEGLLLLWSSSDAEAVEVQRHSWRSS